jgi:thiamine biosynthesis lipoprotein
MTKATQPDFALWEALGTSIVLRVADPRVLAPARAAVEHELDAIDLALSRFREDSELSRANAHAGRSLKASPLFIEALELALRAAELTGGDVDPTLGRALELAGYDRDRRELVATAGEPEPPKRAAILSAQSRAGWRTVIVDREAGAFRTAPGVKLDLGATAKAWAADRSAQAAARACGCGVLLGVGGDIATCGPAPATGWPIRVTDDHRSDLSAEGQTVWIHAGGLATSSTAVRRWSHGGHSMHHILDPRTGMPTRSRWRTVSVAAASCADANIATTAAIVRGEAAPAWLSALGLPARMVDGSGNVTTVADWPLEAGAVTAVGDRPLEAGAVTAVGDRPLEAGEPVDGARRHPVAHTRRVDEAA